MKRKSVFLAILPSILLLFWTLMIWCPLGYSAADFLKVNGKDIRDNFGKGKKVHLYGTNLGGYQWQHNDDFKVMKKSVDGWIKDAHLWGRKYNVPHFIGEFTLFGNAESSNYGLQKFTESGSHWTTWSYKVLGRNNWGMYNTPIQYSNVANIETDDLNTIKYKWSQWNTPEFFSPNPIVINAMKKATMGRKLKHPNQAFATNYQPRKVDRHWEITGSVSARLPL